MSSKFISFISSLEDDVWHAQTGRNAFESWHFDALSDDGREAVIITFYDNYPFSSGYFENGKGVDGDPTSDQPFERFPAVSFCYSVDGRVVLQAINEITNGEFIAKNDKAECRIGLSGFSADSASYGTGFFVEIDVVAVRMRRIRAELEWLSVESDLSPKNERTEILTVSRNMVSPRSDVSGRIALVGRRGKVRRMVHFRGTGSHDHFRSGKGLENVFQLGYSGRAHFIDSTAIFQHFSCENEANSVSKLFLVRDGGIYERDIRSEFQNYERSRYGQKLPGRLSFISADNIGFRVKPLKVIQTGAFEVRMLSEMTLMLRDGKPRKTLGIAEFVTPGRVNSRLFRWVSGLRVGKEGKPPML
ncbi:MAG: hypothetical protein ABIO36_01875 [Pyrinomonadaceae bacterium]